MDMVSSFTSINLLCKQKPRFTKEKEWVHIMLKEFFDYILHSYTVFRVVLYISSLHCRCFGQQWGKMEATSAVLSVNPEELWYGSAHHRGQGEGGSQLSCANYWYIWRYCLIIWLRFFFFLFFFCSYIYCKTDFVLFVIVAFFTDTQTFTFLSQIESVQKH